MIPLKFTAAEVEAAHAEWGANCGPVAIAAVLGLSLAALRPFLGDFEAKRYTNPSLMFGTLERLRVQCAMARRLQSWPTYGLARIQWEGPWTAPGVPPRAAYRHTHWVGANARSPENVGIFDVNCMSGGGWVPLAYWTASVVPWLLEHVAPKASGGWHITHSVEVTP